MKNIDLISGENIKTHFPIRYVPPIVSESLVVTASNSPNNYVYQCDYVDNDWDRINFRSFETSPEIVYSQPSAVYTGRTHLANKGLYEDKPACCSSLYENKINMTIDRHSIYDPRFYGFGSDDWRSYVNPMLGRVQYDYGEVDFIKLPQFITRNILDTADSPIHLNKLAVDQYTKMQLEQRENFQEEWLQRRADDRLQRKMFPLHTMGRKTS
jgi:hypothetical protein